MPIEPKSLDYDTFSSYASCDELNTVHDELGKVKSAGRFRLQK